MTLKKIDYSNLIIYKIVCRELHITDSYVGSTTNFDQRKKQHKKNCYNTNTDKYYYKLYETIRNHGGWENWLMVIVEKCPCEDSYNARKLERFYYEQLKANLNMLRPLQTAEEKKEEHKEYKKTESCKEKAKERWNKYYGEHKDKIIENQKQYYQENIDTIQSRKNEKIECSCGSIISRAYKAKHERTFNHISKTQSLFTS